MGLAFLVVATSLAIKLPYHGVAAAVVFWSVVVAALVIILWQERPPLPAWHYIVVTLLAGLAACIPYISNGRFGILGVSFNNDLAAHLRWSEVLKDPGLPEILPVPESYPLGGHSLVATLSSALAVDVRHAMAALLICLYISLAWAAVELVDGLSRARATTAALLVAVAYTVSAFYAHAAFKELLLTVFLLAMIGIARSSTRSGETRDLAAGIQLGLLAAGIVLGFSYAGVAWPVLAGALWAMLVVGATILATTGRLRRRLRTALARLRPRAYVALVAVGVVLLLSAMDFQRVTESWRVLGVSPATRGSIAATDLGHLAGPVSKREVFGYWPLEDYRFAIESSFVNIALSALAALVACAGFVWWLRRRELAVVAGASATVLMLLYLSWVESPYTASKALVPAGAFVMLIGARFVLSPWPKAPLPAITQAAHFMLVVVFVCGALWSSFLVLRGAKVGPTAHAEELSVLRSRIEPGSDVLFLGNDDYVRYEMHGIQLVLPRADRPGKTWRYGDLRDFDSVSQATLSRVGYVLVPRSAYSSEPPAAYTLVDATHSYELWRRISQPEERKILDERGAPGKVLECKGGPLERDNGWARIWPILPRLTTLGGPAAGLRAGDSLETEIALQPGTWELSLSYTSPQKVDVDVVGSTWSRQLPANLDRPGPYWRIGDLTVTNPEPLRVRISVASSPLRARTHVAALYSLAAVRVDTPQALVHLPSACGRYVDWYTRGQKRPTTQR